MVKKLYKAGFKKIGNILASRGLTCFIEIVSSIWEFDGRK